MYLIAEIGMNYIDVAKKKKINKLHAIKKMITAAKSGGADAVKLQYYKADNLVTKNAKKYYKTDKRSPYKIFKENEGFERFEEVKKYCDKIGIDFFCTCFDKEGLEKIDPLVNAHKIASGDLMNVSYVVEVAKKNKPIYMSVGGATKEEIIIALLYISKHTKKPVTLLHCQIEYPCRNANLSRINELKKEFPKNQIGYSDHCLAGRRMLICSSAYVMGAEVIEKHYTIDKFLTGNDHEHSMDTNQLRTLVKNCKHIDNNWKGFDNKFNVKQARRSLVAKTDLKKDDYFTTLNVECLRPGIGLGAEYYFDLIGQKANKDYKAGDIIDKKEIENK